MQGIRGAKGLSKEEILAGLEAGAKIRGSQTVVSVILLTIVTKERFHYAPAGKIDTRRIWMSLLALIFGWWAFPWGPIRTVETVVRNFNSDADHTSDFRMRLGGRPSPNAEPRAAAPTPVDPNSAAPRFDHIWTD